MVKRWKANVDMWPDQAIAQLDVVKASDYDALAAELAGYKESHDKYCPSAARIRELEALIERELPFARAEGRRTWVSDAAHALHSTSETACEQVKCLHPLHHGWHDRKADCVHPMARSEFSESQAKINV